MLKKCVSLGNAGNPKVTWMPASANPHDFGEAEADMWGGLTSDGLFNTSYFASDQTSTPWVRLFAETDYIFPKPPAPRARVSPKGRYKTATPDPKQLRRLDQNIAQAKHAGLGVILTLNAIPLWLLPPGSSFKLTLPPSNSLLVPGGPPPDGRGYRPTDFAWSLYVHMLMNRYHPHNRRPPGRGGNPVLQVPVWDPRTGAIERFVSQRAHVDYFEIVNEPHNTNKAYPGVEDYHSTALMMIAGQYINDHLNSTYPPPRGKPPLVVFAPATAGDSYRTFTSSLIKQLKRVSYKVGKTTLRFNPAPKSPTFAWSHHNYEDVESFAPHDSAGAAVDALLAAVGVTDRYGPTTQGVRDLLRGGGTAKKSGASWWRGYRSERSTPDPALWLTEGGGRLERLQGWAPGGNSDSDQTVAKRTQARVITKSIAALQRQRPGQPGAGVEMFTNFLFYDEPFVNHSGLCNSYPGTGGSQESSAGYERPAFTSWGEWTST